ncbi:leukocyte elastase inhibitor-like isoform X4 [Amblyraja radiata]|uniref:leukocyte elastase inhibitor-like isoform X4 n=1 Tax=Amblyraja radiata TaxID=386614 RepID=UPI0014038371|nr:leukocyte elastase inhibitor-like isoform X4 [Amblyraja radiata]XP_032905371.1 leukocyte elastase inhibitor-like isoform X4 [Amblyraja radiata]XP_032905378.1 leukocyte elastase inhibitor-like isoform X4 [Amblyraja radiata]XP_032905385.1 leukocyte elastase inhibitor-like isoform X4 [Amblyraja radiata]
MAAKQIGQCQQSVTDQLADDLIHLDPLVTGNIQFALDLFKHLDEQNRVGNIFVSPFSISVALALVYLGAKEKTAAQMAQMLGFDEVKDVHSEFQKLQTELINPKAKYSLKLANRLYGEKTYTFLPDFLAASLKHYQAGLGAVDFLKAAEAARQEINSWTEEQTAGKIQNVLEKGTVGSDTRLVLVNAIYFKAKWKHTFKKRDSFTGQFKLNQSITKDLEMMQRTGFILYFHNREFAFKIIELPYVQDELSMIILLPDDNNGLETLQRSFTLNRLRNWTNPKNMSITSVEVTLPKFKLEEKYDLSSILPNLGMVDAFDSMKANFSGMSEGEDLSVSKVIHQSFVEVDEEGTEAAAATAVTIVSTSTRFPPEEFKADHPFLFFIRHAKTQSILFYGRLTSP